MSPVDVRSAADQVTPEQAIALVSSRHEWSHTDGSPGEWGARAFSHGYVVYPDVNVADATAAPPDWSSATSSTTKRA
jgi:hypothetical protein